MPSPHTITAWQRQVSTKHHVANMTSDPSEAFISAAMVYVPDGAAFCETRPPNVNVPRYRSKDSIALRQVIISVLLSSVPVAFQLRYNFRCNSGLGLARISTREFCLKINKPIRTRSFPPVIFRMLPS